MKYQTPNITVLAPSDEDVISTSVETGVFIFEDDSEIL